MNLNERNRLDGESNLIDVNWGEALTHARSAMRMAETRLNTLSGLGPKPLEVITGPLRATQGHPTR